MKTKFSDMAWYGQILIVLLIIVLSVICIPIILFVIGIICVFLFTIIGLLLGALTAL